MPFQQYSARRNVLRHSVSIGSSGGKGECSLVPRISEPHGREHTGHLWWACARMWGRWAKGKTSPFILEFSSPGSLYLKSLTAVCSWREGRVGKPPWQLLGQKGREAAGWASIAKQGTSFPTLLRSLSAQASPMIWQTAALENWFPTWMASSQALPLRP